MIVCGPSTLHMGATCAPRRNCTLLRVRTDFSTMKAEHLQWAAALSAGLVCLASAGVAWAGAFDAAGQPTSHEVLCQDYEAFAGAILSRGVLADAGLRMRTARLAHAASRYPATPQPGSVPASEAAAPLRLLLNAPYATRRDLFIAARPVAVACGLDWRSGSMWEFAPGSWH